MRRALALGAVVAFAQVASAQMVISEWMYNGAGTGSTGEFIEFTNIGTESVDMTGWSYDDDSRVAGTISLSGFGVVAPGQSVILTDETASDFATIWGLSGVTIIGGNTANIGRNDEINLFDAGGSLVDRLTYGDESYPGTVRTQNKGCSIPATDYSYTTAQTSWVLAVEGDAYGSKVSSRGEIGSPGRIVGYVVYDFDQDGDVDLTDLDVLASCSTGPAIGYDPVPSGCTLTADTEGYIVVDSDQDGDVDQADFGAFQRCYSGEGNPADLGCVGGEDESGDTQITLNGDSITVEGDGVTVDGSKATIISAGTYYISGTLADGQIAVNTADAGVVQLILNGVSISNSTSAAVYVISAEEVAIILADNSDNYLSDAATYVYDDPEVDEPKAAMYSAEDLSISGAGSLTIDGNYNDGISSKDGLVITSGTIVVNAVDDGIRGKDYLVVQGGNITLDVQGDGLKSDNEEDTSLGYISIENGSINIISGGDAIAAETNVLITGGAFTLLSGGGSSAIISEDLSAKGIKGLVSVVIDDGTFAIDSADDAIHSNADVTINGGTFNIASGDDGVHSDTTLEINGGTITITKSYEGIESADVVINNGEIHVTSSDDGINGAGGVDGSGQPGMPPTGNNYLYINGGYIVVNATGDGIDVNGRIEMTGGTVIVHGPTASDNSALDYDVSFNISGGFLVAAGSANMAQAPSTTSTQRSVHVKFSSTKAAGTLVNIQKSGTSLLTFAPAKTFQSVVFSAPTIVQGSGYTLYRGGSSTGTVQDGLYSGGTYTPGTQSATFSVTSIVTTVNNAQ